MLLLLHMELAHEGRAAMSTVGWKDLAFTQTPGPTSFGDHMLVVTEEHIARWKDDPDGRYAMMPSAESASPIDLGKFYPSL